MTSLRFGLSLVIALACTSVAPRSSQLPVTTGRISGRVVDVVTGRPVTSAQVNCGRIAGVEHRVLTGADGAFVCANLPEDMYSLETSRPGYVNGGYDNRRPTGDIGFLHLREGQRRDDVVIELWPFAAVSGEVTDEAGNPLPRVTVTAIRLHDDPIRTPRGTTEPMEATTDDQGRYEISSLLPGTYALAAEVRYFTVVGGASTNAGGALAMSPVPPGSSRGWPAAYATTYWPDAPSLAAATPIAAAAGDRRSSVDIHLQLRPAVTITGTAIGPNGPVAGAAIRIATGEEEARRNLTTAQVMTAADGSFSLPLMPAGIYAIAAEATPRLSATFQPEQRLWGATSFDTANGAAGITVTMASGGRISGRVEYAGSVIPDEDRRTRVIVDIGQTSVFDETMPERDTFEIRGVRPGRGYVRTVMDAKQWKLESVRHNGRDVLAIPLEIGADEIQGLVVTVTDRPATISGRLSSAPGRSVDDGVVIVFPADPASWPHLLASSRRLGQQSVGADGFFRLEMPPGDYFVTALDDRAIEFLPRPGMFEALAAGAERVVLGRSEQRVLNLTIRAR